MAGGVRAHPAAGKGPEHLCAPRISPALRRPHRPSIPGPPPGLHRARRCCRASGFGHPSALGFGHPRILGLAGAEHPTLGPSPIPPNGAEAEWAAFSAGGSESACGFQGFQEGIFTRSCPACEAGQPLPYLLTSLSMHKGRQSAPRTGRGDPAGPPRLLPVGLTQRWAFWGGCLTSPPFLLAVKSPCRGVPWGCVCREHLTPELLVMGTEGALCPRGSRHNGASCSHPAPAPRGRPRPHRATAGCGDARSWGFSLGNLFSLLVLPD